MDKKYCVVGRTFETQYFDTYSEANAYINELPKEVINYDSEISIGTLVNNEWEWEDINNYYDEVY